MDTPIWQDQQGILCDIRYVAGCKVHHKITHPEMYILMDGVDGNMSQKGDFHIGNALLMRTKGMALQ